MGRLLLAWILLFIAPLYAEIRVAGHVTSDTNVPVAGASVTLRSGSESYRSLTDPAGDFAITIPGAGDFRIDVERPGFFALKNHPVMISSPDSELRLVLNPVREMSESVDVAAGTSSVSLDETTSDQQLSGKALVDIPQANTHYIQNAMRALPAVVQDPKGTNHVDGGAENQTLYLLNGFNIGNPLTGAFDTRLSVEAVQSMTIVSGQVPAEYGKGSAGVVSISTRTGDDRIRYSATNFIPGIQNNKGWRLGSWTPRFNVSGPLRRSRAWFSDTFMGQYDETIIRELPPGQDSSRSWRYTNVLRTNVNITPSNILSAGFLSSVWTARRTGLSAIDPPETTSDRRTRQFFYDIKDQLYFGHGGVAEFGFAANRLFLRQIPQGQSLYILTPVGRQGNFYIDGLQEPSRNQVLANVFLPAFRFLGGHQIKTGVDLDRVGYHQDIHRTGFEVLGSQMTPVRKVTYGGSGIVSQVNYEASTYVQDGWRLRPSLLLELGLRSDWDRLLGNWSTSPRIGFAWAPPRFENTKISGGYALMYDATQVDLFTRPYDQYSITSWFPPYGPVGVLSRSLFVIPNEAFATPRFSTWSAAMDHRIGSSTFVKVQALHRRGSKGLAYTSGYVQPSPADVIYQLRNLRTDAFDSVGITVRQAFRKEYEWLAAYTRSAAKSNSVIDLSADTPELLANNLGRLPWDAPNRFVSWGYMPTLWKDWAIAYLMETRSGFPFSVQNDAGYIVGGPNASRYPTFFELNLHVERKFRFRNQVWAGRAGFNNITNHKNPNTVINNINSDRFLQFFGGQSRALVFRIRWLGKV